MKIQIHIPIKPHGKGRAKSSSRIIPGKFDKKGKPMISTRHYTPAKTESYETVVETYARMAMGSNKPFTGPLKVTMLFIFEPHKAPKWKRELELDGKIAHTVKPDIDNLIKSIFDGFNKVVWIDDAQITKPIPEKRYQRRGGAEQGIYVLVEELDQYPAQIMRKPSDTPNT